MKKLFTLVLVACFAFSVVGCGGDGEKKKDGGKKADPPKTETKK